MNLISSENKKKIEKGIQNKVFRIVSECGAELGKPVFVIGGYVRDAILQRPSKDIDFVVAGSGIDLAELVAKKLAAKKVSFFKTYGTAMIHHNGFDLEFVGARKESYNRQSRNPIVENGTLEDDQKRRDFTINAMAISLNKDDYGTLIDPFGGIDHLEEGVIKTPLNPDITFSDDPLRMMRAVRFASQLNFNIDPESFKALKVNKDRIKIITQERITDELNKIILSNHPSIGFKSLLSSGILQIIFPEMADLKGVENINGKTHKDNFYHTLEVLENILPKTNDLWLRWAAIMHDIAKPPTKRFHPKVGWTFHGHEDKGARMVPMIFRRMKLPLDHKMKFVQKMVQLHLRPIALTKEIVTDSALRRLLFDADQDLEALMKLCRADITSKNEAKVKKYLERFSEVEIKIKKVEQRDKIRNWQPPVSGEVIIKTFNLKPCKQIGDIKDAIKEAILEGQIENDYNAAYKFMLKKGKEFGLIAETN